MNSPKMTMVVARYNENLDWLKTVPWNYIVFNKGGNLPKWVKNKVKLPNIGREAHTYLTYIIDNYDHLSNYTIFVQGNPFDHSSDLVTKIKGFDGKSDFFDLSDSILASGRYGNRTRFESKTAESAQRIFLEEITDFGFGKGAQFIVSKKAILFHPKVVYQKILDYMMEGLAFDKICVIHNPGKNCKCTNLFSPWILERLWKTIFDRTHKTIYSDRKILIVGAGISGCVLAERYANKKKKKVLVIDKRDHIGGNCYDYTNGIGLRINKYGPHYFRTNDELVWSYVQKFSKWRPFEAHCVSHVDGKKVPIPVNIDTINMIFGTNIKTAAEMKKFLAKDTVKIKNPKNSEESALKRVGKTLYEKMFKNYTTKQWGKHPKELDSSVMDRLPVRFSHDSRYSTDKYQMYPVDGYTKIFEKMLNHKNVEVRLNTQWDDIKNSVDEYEKIFFTGRIDSYFDEKLGKLEYRSLRFEEINLDQEWFQDHIQENYPDEDIPYTRIVEYKHKTEQVNPKTTIVKEYPAWEGEPYYPVPSAKNQRIYKKYQKQAEQLEKNNIYFVGRLANYKYINMDQAFRNALDLFSKIERTDGYS